jgi:hypothetical protein
MSTILLRRWSLVGTALLLVWPAVAGAQLVKSGSGANAAAITPVRDQFRTDLGGGTVAGANGLFSDATGARREINWDGVPAASSAPNNLAANFFNVNSPRGAVFATAGTGFQVSGATTDSGAGQPAAADFGNIDASYTATFESFSPQRLFSALGSNIMDVNFFVPGSTVPGLTRGFGVVFSDVDLPNTTSIELFDQANVSLGTFFAPNVSTGTEKFSFLGVSYATPVISRVRIANGNVALGAGVLDQNGNPNDLVVMDDFLYGEPVGVPEPASMALVVVGWIGARARFRRPRRIAGKRRQNGSVEKLRTLVHASDAVQCLHPEQR